MKKKSLFKYKTLSPKQTALKENTTFRALLGVFFGGADWGGTAPSPGPPNRLRKSNPKAMPLLIPSELNTKYIFKKQKILLLILLLADSFKKKKKPACVFNLFL